MFTLLFLGQTFGVSSTLRATCAAMGAGKTSDFFRYDWKDQIWNLAFVARAMAGGFVVARWLPNPKPIQLAAETVVRLQAVRSVIVIVLLSAVAGTWVYGMVRHRLAH